MKLFGVGHLGNPLGGNEGSYLDGFESGFGEFGDEVKFFIELDDFFFVL